MKWEWLDKCDGLDAVNEDYVEMFEEEGITDENEFIDRIEAKKIGNNAFIIDIYFPKNGLFKNIRIDTHRLVEEMEDAFDKSLYICMYDEVEIEDEDFVDEYTDDDFELDDCHVLKDYRMIYSNYLDFIPENEEEEAMLMLDDGDEDYTLGVSVNHSDDGRYIRFAYYRV